MLKKFLICVICSLVYLTCVFAQEESITITTYYPSPYGSYRELGVYRMKIGTTYSGSDTTVADNDLIVEGSVGIGTKSPQAKLDVTGNIKFSGQKMCSVMSDGNGNGTAFTITSMLVPSSWTAAVCQAFSPGYYATKGWRLGCIFGNSSSQGSWDGGIPNPNCGW